MWRGLLGLLFLAAAVGCFVAARYAADATNLYVLIDLGCAALRRRDPNPRRRRVLLFVRCGADCHSRSERLLHPCRILGDRVGTVVFRLQLSYRKFYTVFRSLTQ